jgi:hypothetical protein
LASADDKKAIEQPASQLGLAPLLAEVLRESDELT